MTDQEQREKFEAWISVPPFENRIKRRGEYDAWPGQYCEYLVQLAWTAWRKSAEVNAEMKEKNG